MAGTTTYLRCALVWEKTIVEERLFTPSSQVSVGASPRATFTLLAPEAGKRHCLFRHRSGGTVLALKPGMLGQVRISGHSREAEEMTRDDAVADREGEDYLYTLTEGDQGVLVFGRVGLAFNLTARQGKAPAARVLQILDSDPYTTRAFAMALALLLLFSLLSRIFAGTPPAFTVEQLPERVVSFVVEDPEAALEFKKELKRLREEKKKKPESTPQKTRKTRPDKKGPDRKTTDDAATRKIRKKVAEKGVVGALSTASKKDRALRDVMGEGGLGISLASAVQALDRGAAQARVLTSEGQGGLLIPTLAPRRGTAEALGEGLSDAVPATGRTGRRVSRGSRLAERSQAKVVVSIPSSAAQVTGGTLSKKQIFDVVKKNRGAIRYCYESQLMRFPTLKGKITVDFIIDTSGKVQKVKLASNKLSMKAAKHKVASCLIKFISRWRFPKPRGGKVRVIYPFSFGRSR